MSSPHSAHAAAADLTLTELVDRASVLIADGRRRILGVTGAPGAGKSTVTAALSDALGDRAVVVGMDGFHYADVELRRLGRRDRKGAPDTFDVDGYAALLSRLAEQKTGTIYAPLFDRSLEEPIGSAIPVAADAPLVITEGNYLLHDGDGWAVVRPLLDEVWHLDIDARERRRRLVERRVGHGHPEGAAVAWVRDVDEPNARVVETASARADLIVRLRANPHRSGG